MNTIENIRKTEDLEFIGDYNGHAVVLFAVGQDKERVGRFLEGCIMEYLGSDPWIRAIQDGAQELNVRDGKGARDVFSRMIVEGNNPEGTEGSGFWVLHAVLDGLQTG